jgi:circadian clock protein KaiB
MPDRPIVKLRLYVAGNGPNSAKAKRNLDAVLASVDPSSYELEIIDCLNNPARTLADGVIVTPTLVKIAPEPGATVIGTLSDPETVRTILGAQPG